MSKFLIILSVMTLSLSSCGQSEKEYSFKDIGLHIKISNGYIIQDNFPRPSFVDANGKKITEPTKLKELEADLMKGLLVISSTDRNNSVSFNITHQTNNTGNFDQYYTFSKNMQEFMAKQQMTDYDTLSSILHVDSINLHKFLTKSLNAKPTQYSGIYIATIKDYFLIIKADYIDKQFGEDIEKAILSAKFD